MTSFGTRKIEDESTFRLFLLEPSFAYQHREVLTIDDIEEFDLELHSTIVADSFGGDAVTLLSTDLYPIPSKQCLVKALKIFLLQTTCFIKRLGACQVVVCAKRRTLIGLLDGLLLNMFEFLYTPIDIGSPCGPTEERRIWIERFQTRQSSLSVLIHLWLSVLNMNVRLNDDDKLCPPLKADVINEEGLPEDEWSDFHNMMVGLECSRYPSTSNVQMLRSLWSRKLCQEPFSLKNGFYVLDDFKAADVFPDVVKEHLTPSGKFKTHFVKSLQSFQAVTARSILRKNKYFSQPDVKQTLILHKLHVLSAKLDELLETWVSFYGQGILDKYRRFKDLETEPRAGEFREDIYDFDIAGNGAESLIKRPRLYDTNRTLGPGIVEDLYQVTSRDRAVLSCRAINIGIALNTGTRPDYRFTSNEVWKSTHSFSSVFYLTLALFHRSAGLERMLCGPHAGVLTPFADMELIFSQILESADEVGNDLVYDISPGESDSFNKCFVDLLKLREEIIRLLFRLDSNAFYYSSNNAAALLCAYVGLLNTTPFNRDRNDADTHSILEALWHMNGISYVPSHHDKKTQRPGEVQFRGGDVLSPSTELSPDFAKVLVLTQQTVAYDQQGYVDYEKVAKQLDFLELVDDISAQLNVPNDHDHQESTHPFAEGCFTCLTKQPPTAFYYAKNPIREHVRQVMKTQLQAAGVPMDFEDLCFSPKSPMSLEQFRGYLFGKAKNPIRHHITVHQEGDSYRVYFKDVRRPSNSSLVCLGALMALRLHDGLDEINISGRRQVRLMHGVNVKSGILVAQFQDIRHNSDFVKYSSMNSFLARYENFSNVSLINRSEGLVASLFAVVQSLGSFIPADHSVIRLIEKHHGRLHRVHGLFIGRTSDSDTTSGLVDVVMGAPNAGKIHHSAGNSGADRNVETGATSENAENGPPELEKIDQALGIVNGF